MAACQCSDGEQMKRDGCYCYDPDKRRVVLVHDPLIAQDYVMICGNAEQVVPEGEPAEQLCVLEADQI